MEIISLHKISEFHISQWEGDLDDGRCVYVRIKNDRLSVGIAESYAQALTRSISFPYIDKFLMRNVVDWGSSYSTKKVIKDLNKSGFNCSQLNHEKIEENYKNGRL